MMIRRAAGQEKPVHFIDLGKVYHIRWLAFCQGFKSLTEGRLHNISRPIFQRFDG